jgi:hypothetical protein
LEPLSVPRLEFKEGSGNFKFTQVLTNLTIHGLGAFQLQNVKWVAASYINALLQLTHSGTPRAQYTYITDSIGWIFGDHILK